MGIRDVEKLERPRSISGAPTITRKEAFRTMPRTDAMAPRAAIYARFSCSKQREASIEDQIRVCREWCGREGYEVVAEYADYAISGRTDDRPEFKRMMSRAGESDIVLVYMMDRFSRDAFDAPIYKRELQRHGVRLVSALEQIPDSPEGIIYEKLLEGLAACESKKTAIRTRRGMEGNALKCKTNGVRVYGYRRGEDDTYEIDPEEAAVVRDAFDMRLSGMTVNAVARELAIRGVKTRTGRPCGYTMARNMLQNEKYRGVYMWDDVRVEGGMPRIVEDEDFFLAQEVRGGRFMENETRGAFMLSSKLICAECGRGMKGTSGKGKSGKKYEYYACGNCGAKPVRCDELEATIAHSLREVISDEKEAMRIAEIVLAGETDEELAAERKRAEKALRDAERRLSNLLAVAEDGIDIPGMKERVRDLKRQKARAEKDLELVDEAEIDPEDFAMFLRFGATLDDEALLEAFVYQAMVGPEEIVVTLNYDDEKGEPARISLERVRLKSVWCPVGKSRRTLAAFVGGMLVMRIPRAA